MSQGVRVQRICDKCDRRYWSTATLVEGDNATRVRSALRTAVHECPWCGRRHNVAGDLFKGRGLRPGNTHPVARTPAGDQE